MISRLRINIDKDNVWLTTNSIPHTFGLAISAMERILEEVEIAKCDGVNEVDICFDNDGNESERIER